MKELEVSIGVPRGEAAFNRLELVVVLATLALLTSVALPTFGNTKTRSQRVTCVANLRQIGHAVHVVGNDYGDLPPWRLSVVSEGTIGPSPLRNKAWYQFASISNQLGTPKILICPADKIPGNSRIVASNWSAQDPIGGYQTLGFRDRATSYTIGLDAFIDQPRSILSSDRNVRLSGVNTSGSSMVGTAYFFNVGPLSTGPGWTNTIHFQSGNMLFYDGQVQQISIAGFSNVLNAPYLDNPNFGSDNGSLHFLIPN